MKSVQECLTKTKERFLKKSFGVYRKESQKKFLGEFCSLQESLDKLRWEYQPLKKSRKELLEESLQEYLKGMERQRHE